MTVAYLILAHDNPAHLARLIQALESHHSKVFVHIDAKISLKIFANIEELGAIIVKDRVRVYWGGWSQVEATLRLIASAVNHEIQFSHFALLSGADYPLSTTDVFLEFLSKTNSECIDTVKFPNEEMSKWPSRLTKRWIEGGERRKGWSARAIRLLNRLLGYLPDRDVNTALKGIPIFTGSQWWVLSRDAIDYIQAFADRNKKILKFFRFALIPDEIFFQTVVSSMPNVKIGRGLTYTDWSENRDGPATITHSHIEALEISKCALVDGFGQGQAFFARKFDGSDGSLYQKADAMRERRKFWR